MNADTAYHEWQGGLYALDPHDSRTAFLAGYRRALQDAADELDYEGNLYMEEVLRIADGLKLSGSFTIQSARQLIQQSRTEPAEWLRDRAVRVTGDTGGNDG